MEIEYQLSKKDYIKFNRLYIKDSIRRNRLAFIFFVLILIYALSGKYTTWWELLFAIVISPLITYAIFYLLPFFISLVRLNKALSKDKSGLERKKLNITNEGLLIESESKTTVRRWESIISVNANKEFIYLVLADKKIVPFPKKDFRQDSEATNFLGIIQTKIIQLRGISQPPFSNHTQIKAKKPSYLLGLLCLIPVIGALAGLVFIINGISRYKDKWFVIIGVVGIIFTASLWYTYFYTDTFGFKTDLAKTSQRELNEIMVAIEFYKFRNGVYPDNLEQINTVNSQVWMLIYDPLQPGGKAGKNNEYNYQKVGNHYYLFSSGIDEIPGTKDDIYPQVTQQDSAKFGLIHK